MDLLLIKKILILAITLPNYIWATYKNDFCDKGDENTPCKYLCQKSEICGDTNYTYKRLNENERDMILDKHNKLRNEVAYGKYTKKYLPAASNMRAMSWDKEAEFFAACYILECIWGHDKLRIAEDGTPMGQNLYTKSSSLPWTLEAMDMVSAVQTWFDEINFLTAENTKTFFTNFKPVKSAGHLTKIIWAETYKVGCAKMFNLRGRGFTWDFICNYRPAGNLAHSAIYLLGFPKCTRNDKYNYLCGGIRLPAEDPFRLKRTYLNISQNSQNNTFQQFFNTESLGENVKPQAFLIFATILFGITVI